MALYEEYRPLCFDDIVGHSRVIARVKKIVARKGYQGGGMLFTGPSGCGKTSLALCVGNELVNGSKFHAMHFVDSRTCDLGRVQRMESNMWLMAPGGGWKVYIIDECHEVSKPGQNYLLGLLERMPPRRLILATTTENTPFSGPLMSRWALFRMNQMTEEEIVCVLELIAESEAIDLPPADLLSRVIGVQQGNLRALITDVLETGEYENYGVVR